MSFEKARQKMEVASDVEDVAEKRFLMFKSFEEILSGLEKDSFRELKGFDGFLYKNSQDFLLSSSTFDKEKKLEKIMGYVERKYRSEG